MALNIKNQRVCDLARQAAEATGKSQVSVIEEALERMLHEVLATHAHAREAKLARLREIGEEFRNDPGDPDREIKTIEDLYDEKTGLPR